MEQYRIIRDKRDFPYRYRSQVFMKSVHLPGNWITIDFHVFKFSARKKIKDYIKRKAYEPTVVETINSDEILKEDKK